MSLRAGAALDALRARPAIQLGHYPTPVEELSRLRDALGGGPRLFVKRDDAIAFAFGGNKVRKLEMVAAEARAQGADTLVTMGGIQSNHARVTAAAAARLGLRAVLVLNGAAPATPTANVLLDELVGAEVVYVPSRDDRAPTLRAVVDALGRAGRRPYEIPLGASTPLGALGYVRAAVELAGQMPAPDAIVCATSSGGTQAGLVAGCALLEWPTEVIGISADEAAAPLARDIGRIVSGIGPLLGVDAASLARPIEVDDRFVGEGYGIPTEASREALALAARTEALFLDQTYTAKALAGLIARVRDGRLREGQNVLFWHTGGQVGLFAR